MPDQRDVLWEWSVFWHSDQLQSCLPASSSAGIESLQGRWRDFFDALPDGAEFLDLGTGNGGLATQAVVASQTRVRPFSIHGVDLADIKPESFVSSADSLLAGVEFHARTTMEDLPFDDGFFDAVASQYAIEYSNTEKSIPEALRVLRVGGAFRFLLHADDGVLKQRCLMQEEQAQTILGSALFMETENMLRSLVSAEVANTPDSIAAAEQAIATLKRVFDELDAQFARDEDRSLVDNLFAAIRSLPDLRRSHGISRLVTMAQDIQNLLHAQARRLASMQNAALSDSAAKGLVDRLETHGAKAVVLEPATTGREVQTVGYWLSGEKAEAA